MQWYFHGSPNVDDFINELVSTGEVWIEARGKSTGSESYWYDADTLLEPIAGRVYLTTDIEVALEYARGGVVLLVALDDDVEIWPDEDCLGAAFQYATTEGGERPLLDPYVVCDDPEVKRELRSVYDTLPEEIQDMYQESVEPDLPWLAAAGKFALTRGVMSSELIEKLVRTCDAVSVPGPVRVAGAYILDGGLHPLNYQMVAGEDARLPPVLVGATYIRTASDVEPSDNPSTQPSKYTRRYHELYGSGGDLSKVSRQTGIPRPILQRVYNRGLAAWEKSHRPGTAQHQWAMARVYSFAVGGKTWETTDADLAKEARKSGFRVRPNPELEDSITRILESGGVRLDAPLTELGQGVEVYAFASMVGDRPVVAKLYQSPSSSTEAARQVVVHQGRLGRSVTGLVEVFAVCESEEGIVVLQERATLCTELDMPGAERMGKYAAPVIAEALEDAIQCMAEGWEPSDPLAAKFRRQLISGARVLGGPGAELDFAVEWHVLNVGVTLRRGEPKAAIFDFGAP